MIDLGYNISEDYAKKILSTTFGLVYDAIEFAKDLDFQNENRAVLHSRNIRNIIYRIGRTEERYDAAISLYYEIENIAVSIKHMNTPVSMPIMHMAYQQHYAVCANCYTPVTLPVLSQNYFWTYSFAPKKCYECSRLERLNDSVLLYAVIKKAHDKGAEKALEKSVDWLAGKFGNYADEIKRVYYGNRCDS